MPDQQGAHISRRQRVICGQAYEAGFATLLTFMAVISLNLGILNILPIPILDGGVILLLVIESLMGRDLSLRMKERIMPPSRLCRAGITVTSWRAERGAIGRHNTKSSI